MSTPSLILPSKYRFGRSPSDSKSKIQGLLGALEIDFNLTTTLLVGASVQALLTTIAPVRYAVLPALFLLGLHVVDVILVSYNLKANPFMSGVLAKKSTAQVLSEDGSFGGPGKEKIAVLLLGAKSNHPLGFFAPGFAQTGEFLGQMTAELESSALAKSSGFLGQTAFTRKDANGATENIQISYWRSIQHVHDYAHGPTHRQAWLWWDKNLKQHQHIGLMHEVFEAPAGMWESLYVNFQPTMLGATSYLKVGEKLKAGNVDEQWVSGLLDANRGLMRTSPGRRGVQSQAADYDKNGKNYYVE